MRISDLIAAAAMLVALIGAFMLHRQKTQSGTSGRLDTTVRITYGVDKKKAKSKGSGEQNPPGFKGTFTLGKGRVQLESAQFIIRRKSNAEYLELHAFSAEFDPPRERPTVEAGHLINASPKNLEGFKASLVDAEAVFVEFKDNHGQVFRSPELSISS
jgi:hypothetical protein